MGTKHYRRTFYDTPASYDDMAFDECMHQFISVSVKLPHIDLPYKLLLSGPDETYYVAGNRVNQEFIKYLLHSLHGIENVDNYNLHYMDANVNVGEITHNEEIVFLENGYVIRPYVKGEKFAAM